VPGFGLGTSIDKVGAWATAGVGVGFTVHSLVQLTKRKAAERKLAAEAKKGEAS